jgi:hypothetical protein
VKHTSAMNQFKRVNRTKARNLLDQGVQLYSSLFNGAIIKVEFTRSIDMNAYEATLSKYYLANLKYYIEK